MGWISSLQIHRLVCGKTEIEYRKESSNFLDGIGYEIEQQLPVAGGKMVWQNSEDEKSWF